MMYPETAPKEVAPGLAWFWWQNEWGRPVLQIRYCDDGTAPTIQKEIREQYCTQPRLVPDWLLDRKTRLLAGRDDLIIKFPPPTEWVDGKTWRVP